MVHGLRGSPSSTHVSSARTIVSDSRLGFLASLQHPSGLRPCLNLGTILQLKTMHTLCISSRRSNALFSTAVLVLVVWAAVRQWKTVDDQRVRLGHTISRLHFPSPPSGSVNGQSRLSTLPPPSDSSTLVTENLSASNSTLGVSRIALLPLRPTTDLPLSDSSPKSSL